jgi:hypothetical protein
MKPLPHHEVRANAYLWALSQASNLNLLANINHWQRAERLHYCSDLLNDVASHYHLYAELYFRQGNLKKFQDCMAKAKDLQALAATSHISELQEWRLAHHDQRLAQQSQHRIQQVFLRMMVVYLAGCLAVMMLGMNRLLNMG